MEDKPNQGDHVGRWQILDVLGKTYGPYAFGLVSLLIIWYGIVQPELKNRAINFEANQAIIKSLSERDAIQSTCVDALWRTSESLEETAELLSKIANRLEARSDATN